MSVETGTALMQLFLAAAHAIPDVTVTSEVCLDELVNDHLFQADDAVGENYTAGSRLTPEATYRDKPEPVGQVTKSCWRGALSVSEHPHFIRAALRTYSDPIVRCAPTMLPPTSPPSSSTGSQWVFGS
ncbi:hypothetical protein C8J57DRAFT_1531269 [Mycena rebaudengoi]|nr:hypothetical protein C8J57DRAFT_1531269 [Mycena rebaudengoi]